MRRRAPPPVFPAALSRRSRPRCDFKTSGRRRQLPAGVRRLGSKASPCRLPVRWRLRPERL